jgi:DNA-binding MarR family transcriptional regulator
VKIEEAIKQSKFENSYQKALINVIYTANFLRDRQNEMFKAYGLLPQHYNVLRIMNGRFPEAVSAGEIKEVMLDKGNDVTRLVDKLVKLGLAKRSLCKTNRRKMDIIITQKGIQLIKEISDPLKKQITQLKKTISEKEAELLSDLLDKFRI